jgi:hypothetical protein
MVEFEFDRRLYHDSRRWIESECISADALHAVVGIAHADLDDLHSAGIVPRATYQIYDTGIVSPVASLGRPGRALGTYYGIAVIGWLARASAYRGRYGLDQLASRLRAWVERDFRTALLAQAETAAQFGWSRVFEAGRLQPQAFDGAAATLWSEWLDGGWVVCLNQFSGYDVVSKDLELERIPALAAAMKEQPGVGDDLLEAMLRFDRIVRPFAPFERPMSSRRRVIDTVALECGIVWPGVASRRAEPRPIRQDDILRCA